MGINFFEQDILDAATLLHFRPLLEEKGIGKVFFDAISRCLERAGRMTRGGTIVNASLVNVPSSTKTRRRSGTESKTALSFLPLNAISIADRTGCPRVQATPLTGSNILRNKHHLCDIKWSTPIGS